MSLKFFRFILKYFGLDDTIQTDSVESSITLDGGGLCSG